MKLSFFKKRRWLIVTAALVLLVVAGIAFSRLRVPPSVPTAEVRRGEFVDYIGVRGDVDALKSVAISAPVMGGPGGDLQIVRLAKTGAMVKKGDVICQFDTTTLQRMLDQRQTELKAADAEINRGRAQAHMVDEQNTTELLNARYNVERGKLDVSKAEILSEIDGEKNKLTLSDSQQKLAETEQKVKSGQISNDADIASRRQKRDKALYDVRQAEGQIAALTLRAPADGMVTLAMNYRAGQMGNWPDFKEGDRAWPGANIASLPDLSSIRISARVDESDRGRLKIGQQVTIRIDAVPDKEFSGTISDISALAKLDWSSWPITKNFNIDIKVDNSDARIRPGMSASARIIVDRVPDSILVPSNAVFQKGGRPTVYVLHRSSFEERAVEIGRRSASDLLVRGGLKPGERVALKDPTLQQEQAK